MSFSDKEYLRKFGGRVKRFREEKKLSQEQLANALGYTTANARAAVYKIEHGLIDLSAAKIKQLAVALGVTVSELMGWSEEEIIEEKLTPDELEIVEMYRGFNEEGREEAHKRLDEMAQLEKYKKCSELGVAKKEA